MGKAILAIVGRPNVGKSTLFNTLAGEKISIVEDHPGVTRDRIYADVTWLNHSFSMIDTGGIEMDSKDKMLKHMREQADIAIDTADVILFLVDVRQGLVDADFKVADMLRKSGKPVILVVNKVDNFEKYMPDVYEFYNLGIGDPHPISAASKLGIGDMLDAVMELFDLEKIEEEEDDRPKIAIVGKPNAGKSSLMNILLDEDRAIVTDIAGTTRDALQESVRLGGLMLNLIDTAGIHNTEDTVEKIGVDRAKQYIEQADFILFVVDGSEEWSDEDEQIIPLIAQKKGVILLNKADLKAKVSEQLLKDKLSWDTIAFSNETKQGLQQLEQYITDKFERGDLQFNDQICLTSIRHKNAVMQAVNALHRVEQSIKDGMPEDFFTIDLMEAYQQLGLINGDTATEDLVNKIFEEFCMGK